MSQAFHKIMAGLEDAQAYLQGARDGYEVRDITVSEPDVASIRGRTGLSQPAFARSIGVPLGTLKNWEQGRRRPEGPTRVLLALIARRPSIVQEALGIMSEPKKHHYLPQFYLEKFKISPQTTKYPRVFVIEKSIEPRSFPAPIHDTGCIRDYNTLDLEEGRDRTSIEDSLSRVEAIHSGVLSQLIASRSSDAGDREELSFLIALMYCRVPKFKGYVQNTMKNSVDTLGQMMVQEGQLPPPPPALARELRNLGLTRLEDIVTVEITNWAVLGIMYQCAASRQLRDPLSEMNIDVMIAPRGFCFITGDTPVAVYGGTLYDQNVEVTFPVSPHLMILLSRKATGERCRQISVEELCEYNRRTVIMSDKYLYSHTTNAAIVAIVSENASRTAGWRTGAFEHSDGAYLVSHFVPVR